MTKLQIQFPQLLYECNIELFVLNNMHRDHISITECNTPTAQTLPIGFRTTIHLKNTTATSDNNSTILSQDIPYNVPLLSDIAVIILNSIAVLTPNGQFLDCATVAFSKRYFDKIIHFRFKSRQIT